MSCCVLALNYPVWGSSCLFDLTEYLLFHVGEIFSYNLFKNFLKPFPFISSSGSPNFRILVYLSLPQGSLRLSILLIPCSLLCSSAVISTILSSSSLIRSSASDSLLLVPFRVYLILVILLSLYVCSLIHLGLCSLILAFSSFLFSRVLIIFAIIILNYFSDSLPISPVLIWSFVFVACSIIHIVFFCLFIFFECKYFAFYFRSFHINLFKHTINKIRKLIFFFS